MLITMRTQFFDVDWQPPEYALGYEKWLIERAERRMVGEGHSEEESGGEDDFGITVWDGDISMADVDG